MELETFDCDYDTQDEGFYEINVPSKLGTALGKRKVTFGGKRYFAKVRKTFFPYTRICLQHSFMENMWNIGKLKVFRGKLNGVW